MKQGFKRIVSMALIASMIATMAPSTAWAASVDNTDAAQVEAQTATDEEVVPAAESAAETEAVEVQSLCVVRFLQNLQYLTISNLSVLFLLFFEVM